MPSFLADVVNDWRARVAGGLEVGVMLWERCCIPSLLYGAGTWVNITAGAVARLNKLQNWFLRLLLQVGQGAPLTALAWESGCLDMGLRVAIEKIRMVQHIRSLEENSLANKIYQEQKKNGWPGLAKEARQICNELEIQDVNITEIPKKEYNKIVMEACKKKHKKDLKEMGDKSKKCERVLKDDYGMKSYFENRNIHEARQLFRTRASMQPFAGNYSHSAKFKRTQCLCKCRVAKEEEGHLVKGECSVYADIWEKFDSLEDDESLVKFFGEVLARRDALDEEESRGGTAPTSATDTPLAGGDSGEPTWGIIPSLL